MMLLAHRRGAIRRFLLAIALAAVAAAARSQPTAAWSSPEAFAEASGLDVLRSAAAGDLNGDGRHDWAGVAMHPDSPTAWSRPQTLYVLLQGPDGLFRVAVQSKTVAESGLGCCWVESVRIERNSLVVEHFAKTAYSQETASHRFSLRNGRWRLVGRTLHYRDESKDLSTRQDWNLLTGKREDWKQVRSRPGAPRTSVQRVAPAFLEDYDFEHDFGAHSAR